MSHSICILGYAEETRDLTRNLPVDVEIWGINMAHVFLPEKANATEWFQIHPQEWRDGEGHYGRPEAHVKWLAQFARNGGKVWLQQPDERIKGAKLFPFSDIFVKAGRDYATSSFAYQLAMLWYRMDKYHLDVSDLYIYGIRS